MHMLGNADAFTFKIGGLYNKYGESLLMLNILVNCLPDHSGFETDYSYC